MGAKNLFNNAASLFGKAALLAAVLCLAVLFISCRKKKEVVLEEYTPLSKEANDLSGVAQWAYEIENGRLEKKIDSFEAIDKSVPLLPMTIVALDGGSPMTAVYPELDGFGSLDTSPMQGELYETIKNFCSGVLEYLEGAAEFDAYQERLKKSEDGASESGEEEVPQKDSSKIDALFSSRSIFSLALFLADSRQAGLLKSFVIGRPFMGDDLMEVPVLWTGENEKLYTRLYPRMEGESWKIQQIEIYKSEVNDGSGKTDRN